MRKTTYSPKSQISQPRSQSQSKLSDVKSNKWRDLNIHEDVINESKVLIGIRRQLLLKQKFICGRMNKKMNQVTLEGKMRFMSAKNQLKLQCMRDGSSECFRQKLHNVFEDENATNPMLETDEIRQFIDKTVSPSRSRLASTGINFHTTMSTGHSPSKESPIVNRALLQSPIKLPKAEGRANLRDGHKRVISLPFSKTDVNFMPKVEDRENVLASPRLPLSIPSTSQMRRCSGPLRRKDPALEHLYRFIHKPKKVDKDILNIKKQIDRLKIRYPRNIINEESLSEKSKENEPEEVEATLREQAKFLLRTDSAIKKYVTKEKAKITKKPPVLSLFKATGDELLKNIETMLYSTQAAKKLEIDLPSHRTISPKTSRNLTTHSNKGFGGRPLMSPINKVPPINFQEVSTNRIGPAKKMSSRIISHGGWISERGSNLYARSSDQFAHLYGQKESFKKSEQLVSPKIQDRKLLEAKYASMSSLNSQNNEDEKEEEEDEIDIEVPYWVNTYVQGAHECRKDINKHKKMYSLAHINPKVIYIYIYYYYYYRNIYYIQNRN